ncbi:MAG: alpha-glucan family phosphorylase [Elusimicrobiota bacterium]|jgi:starch phosphorylase|nr:alpha-glucan family phosphorylase [Elusimicrobiota bacterium]
MNLDLFNESRETFKARNKRIFTGIQNIPEVLQPLITIANNMWWSWDAEAIELFRRIDRDMWEETYHNPKKLLGKLSNEQIRELCGDDSFILHMERVKNALDKYLSAKTWYDERCANYANFNFAYFSTEFAIHESLPIYSGGLGVLSGDHLKSASDMGLPLIGVGLLYKFGYFKQLLNLTGWQNEEYVENDFLNMALTAVKNDNGEHIEVSIDSPLGKIFARAWKVQVGRVPLYLLDTDYEKNSSALCEITRELYGGNKEMRIQQEIVLGIGGAKLLKALNISPDVIHINEGHSAFLLLEKMRQYIEDDKLPFETAFQLVKSGSVFTTHTPVPAGNEIFGNDLILKYLQPMARSLQIPDDFFLKFGSFPTANPKDFSMTIFALKATSKANGVSRLHATVSRDMWQNIWTDLPRKEIPITHITNGIHINTWTSYEFHSLFNKYLGLGWKDEPSEHNVWERISKIPDTELWRSHEIRRGRLVSFARARLHSQLRRNGVSEKMASFADEVLDPEALTIGFARRFASYKRGNLIFRDLARIKKILTNKDYPVQIIMAGKAHPQDTIGKKIIENIITLSKDPELKHKIVFLEDYDINVARYLVQGADIWLNNPLRPEEASGTSGMKAAANGVLNFSILDGWWCEGYDEQNGWSIGSINEHPSREEQDDAESQSIYETLENDIIPLFFSKTRDDIPRGWIQKMKRSMKTLCPVFNTNRMIEEYVEKFYIPASIEHNKLKSNAFELAYKKSDWINFIRSNWNNIHFISSQDTISGDIKISNFITIRSKINLSGISAEDVSVQIFNGQIDAAHAINSPSTSEMNLIAQEDNNYVFEGKILVNKAGKCAYSIRILPKYLGEVQYIPEIIKWI